MSAYVPPHQRRQQQQQQQQQQRRRRQHEEAHEDVIAELRQSGSTYHLLSGVELPSPQHGYPTLDVLGSLTSTKCSKGSTPSQIVDTLRERCRVETGLILQRELMMGALMDTLTNASSTPGRDSVFQISTPDTMISEPEPEYVENTVHFEQRVAESERPNGAQAMAAAEHGMLVQRKGSRSVRNHIVSVEEHDKELDRACEVTKAVRVVYDDWAQTRTMITTLFQTRMQLVVLVPGTVAAGIMAHEPALRGTRRSRFAREHGSGVSGLSTLDVAAVSDFPADGHNNCDEEATWAATHVSEELKCYADEQTGIRRCGINPDFKNLYLRCHRQALHQSLASSEPGQCAVPTLHWAQQPGKDHVPVVFLTVKLPESVDLRLLSAATGMGQHVLSIATSAEAHPKCDLAVVTIHRYRDLLMQHKVNEDDVLACLQDIVDAGADPIAAVQRLEIPRGWETQLGKAAYLGFAKWFAALVGHGADVNEVDAWNETPLMVAAKYGHASIVEQALQLGADPTPVSNMPGLEGMSALDLVGRRRGDEVTCQIIKHMLHRVEKEAVEQDETEGKFQQLLSWS
eukprot:COSAG02_NODE_263_length_26627_cov_47.198168_16_plen_571_part_00